MATNTTKLGLRKPGENDFYNQQTEQADNWDKVDKFADDIQNLVDNNSGKKITGYIQDSGEKILGNYYLDKLATGLFKCIKSGNINYNSSEYFENDSNYALSDKLKNLYTKDTFSIKLNNTNIEFEKRGNIVFVQASCSVYSGEGVFVSTIEALPAKFRPTKSVKFCGNAATSPFDSEFTIDHSGKITLQQTTGTYSFAHVTYFTVG